MNLFSYLCEEQKMAILRKNLNRHYLEKPLERQSQKGAGPLCLPLKVGYLLRFCEFLEMVHFKKMQSMYGVLRSCYNFFSP